MARLATTNEHMDLNTAAVMDSEPDYSPVVFDVTVTVDTNAPAESQSGTRRTGSTAPNQQTLRTQAPAVQLTRACITQSMRELIYRCMATNPNQRPTLEAALAICKDAVLNRGEEGDLRGQLSDAQLAFETDVFLGQFIHGVLLDAEVTAEAERELQGRQAAAAALADRKRKRLLASFGNYYASGVKRQRT